jgi:hypothetical protein
MNIGNLNKRLRLQCKTCGWVPPEGAQMEAVQLHFQVDHDTDGVELDLLPACRCGESMTHAESATAHGATTDFFRCGVCGNTGHVTRKAGTHPLEGRDDL